MPTDVIMPALEMSQDEGTLVRWLKAEGDHVEKGEPLMEIETDKAMLEIEAPGSGTLCNITTQDGDEVPVGEVIAVLVKEGEEVPPLPQTARQEQRTEEKPSAASSSPTRADPGPDATAPRPVRASPKAKRLARQLGIDLATVIGSGPDGTIQVSDLEGSPDQQTAPSADPAEYTSVPIKGMRKVIAERMQASYRTAPHISLSLSVDTSLVQQRIEEAARGDGPSPKFTSILTEAVSTTLKEHPLLNAHLIDQEIRQFHDVHLGVAVALDEGLVVPVIRNADQKPVLQIQSELQDLAERARNRRLQPEEMKGSTFTISNLGMYGIEQFTAIINPPEVGILSVGAVVQTPVAQLASPQMP